MRLYVCVHVSSSSGSEREGGIEQVCVCVAVIVVAARGRECGRKYIGLVPLIF